MDEADRCDRVALIQRGRILGDRRTRSRSPRRFGRPLFAVRGRRAVSAAARALREYPNAATGLSLRRRAALHRRRAGGDRRSRSRATCAPISCDARVRRRRRASRLPPTIEDVFMARMGAPRSARRDRAAARTSRSRRTSSRARFGTFTAVDHITFDVARGRGLRLPRRERRGEDDGDPDAHRPPRSHVGERARSPATTSTRESERIKRAHRLHEPAVLALRGSHGRARTSGSTAGSTTSRRADRASARRACSSRLGLEQSAERRRCAALPLGWKQKLAFSVALLHEPSVVFLDEPTSGVDPITRRQFWELIYEAARARHDRVRHDPLHGRSRVLRSHLDHGGGTDRGDRRAGGAQAQFGVATIDELFVRLARPAAGAVGDERVSGAPAQGGAATSSATGARCSS